MQYNSHVCVSYFGQMEETNHVLEILPKPTTEGAYEPRTLVALTALVTLSCSGLGSHCSRLMSSPARTTLS